MKSLIKINQVLIILLLVLFATITHAFEVRIDFGDDSPDPLGNWNIISDVTMNSQVNNLIDFNTGLQTSIGILGNGWLDDDPINPQWNGGLDRDWIANRAVMDDIYTDASNASATFNGLIPGEYYYIDILSAYSFPDQFSIADIRVNGQFADSNVNGTPGQLGDDWNILTQGFDAANYLIWNSVQADVNGEIQVTLDYVAGYGVDLTAARIRSIIRAVPTINVWGMIIFMILAGFGSMYYIRRNKHGK